jgi:hypothetical protein
VEEEDGTEETHVADFFDDYYDDDFDCADGGGGMIFARLATAALKEGQSRDDIRTN